MNSESNFDARMCIAYIIVSCFLLPLCHHKENIITNVGKYNTLNALFKWLPVMNHTHYRRKIAFAIQFDQKLPCLKIFSDRYTYNPSKDIRCSITM